MEPTGAQIELTTRQRELDGDGRYQHGLETGMIELARQLVGLLGGARDDHGGHAARPALVDGSI